MYMLVLAAWKPGFKNRLIFIVEDHNSKYVIKMIIYVYVTQTGYA